jgi:hypothetical protein
VSTKRKRPSGDPRKDGAQAYRDAYKCGHCNGIIVDGPGGWAVGHRPGCPVPAGAADNDAAGRRAAAAASEATGEPVVHGSFFAGVHEQMTTGPIHHAAGPRAEAIISRTLELLESLDECPHLSPGQPAYVLGHQPDAVLCVACWFAAEQRLTGTREDATCDHCRKWQPPVPVGQTRIYPSTYHPVPGRDLTLILGLCPPCWEADQAGAPI